MLPVKPTDSLCLTVLFSNRMGAEWFCVSELEAVSVHWAYTHEKCKYVSFTGIWAGGLTQTLHALRKKEAKPQA